MSDFAALPDLSLLCIFSHLPPRDLLGAIPLVCRSWRRLAREACRRTTTIAIIGGDEAKVTFHLYDYEEGYFHLHRLGALTGPAVARILDHAFRVESLGLPYCERLVETFPHTSSLALLMGSANWCEIAPIECLVNHWATSLTRLSIMLPHPEDLLGQLDSQVLYLVEYVENLLSLLHRLTRLRVLTLFFLFLVELPLLDVPFLGQLEQLDLSLPCSVGEFLDALLAQRPATGPSRITLSDPLEIEEAVHHLTWLGQANQIPFIASKFPHLRINLSNDMAPMQILAHHFRHLQSLELWFSSYVQEGSLQIQALSGPLSQLSELHTLKLIYTILGLSLLDQQTQENARP